MNCRYCDNEFSPKRSTAKYCSPKCRVYDKRHGDFKRATEKLIRKIAETPDHPGMCKHGAAIGLCKHKCKK